jgi:dihydropteroate synthase
VHSVAAVASRAYSASVPRPYNSLMPFAPRAHTTWQLRSRALETGRRTLIMGILNVTPDSFSDGGRFRNVEEAIESALRMFEEGASIVDVGGESTRPGAYEKISSQQEVDRVLPAIEGIINAKPDALISVDTYRASTAGLAVDGGAEIVNDVSGFLWDPAMAEVCASLRCGVVLMHTRERPEEWASLPTLVKGDIVPLVLRELRDRLSLAEASGIDLGRTVIDPGFGFGKNLDGNYELLAGLDALLPLGRPILAGMSRKGFLGRTLSELQNGAAVPAGQRGNANLAANTAAVLNGASILRVHDIRESLEAAAIADAVLSA